MTATPAYDAPLLPQRISRKGTVGSKRSPILKVSDGLAMPGGTVPDRHGAVGVLQHKGKCFRGRRRVPACQNADLRILLELDDSAFQKCLHALMVFPITWEIARMSTELDFSSDPADEIIAATSIVEKMPLLTRDRPILESRIVPFPQSQRGRVPANHLLAVMEQYFMDQDIHTSWATVRDESRTHQVVTMVLPKESCAVLRIRKGTTPEPVHREIYRALQVPLEVIRPAKASTAAG